jgi:Transglycosylase SLT domain/Domain of unknown function (DUF4124)
MLSNNFMKLMANVPVMKSLIVNLMTGILLLTGLPAAAEIFKYKDRSGNVHFTDKPMKKGSGLRLLWRSGSDPRFGPVSRINTGAMKRNQVRYAGMINSVAKNTRIRPELLHAVVRAESAYDPKARSSKGAEGLMQLMPATASRYNVSDSLNPEQNLKGGAAYLRYLLKRYDSDLMLALAAYNAGENAVEKHGNQVPPFPETQKYVRQVIKFYQQNRLSGSYMAVR